MSDSDRRSALLRWLQGTEGASWGTDPQAFDPQYVESTLARIGWMFGPGRYFGLEARGWEHLPPPPVMVISNHSGGTSIPDVWGFGTAWYRHFGQSRPIHGMAHEMIFSLPRVARAFTRLGVLRGAPHLGAQVLGQLRRDLLVMPGGDRDTWRPFSQRYKVNFAGRKGYARLALQMGVPIVPVAHVGAQHTLLVLSDGSRFARAVGLQKIARASIFPVHISVPWGLTVGPLPHLPLPVRLRYRIGPPVAPPPGPEREEQPSDERVAAYDASVQRAIQGLLDELRAERRGWMRGRLRRMARKLGPGDRR